LMSAPGSVDIKIYTLSGELVFETQETKSSAGGHEFEWTGHNNKGQVIRNGVYVCVIRAGGETAKFRIAVAK
jgi:flagellar hook assembly protein FlgD